MASEKADLITPLRSSGKNRVAKLRFKDSPGLLSPSCISNVDDTLKTDVNTPSVLFGDTERRILRQIYKPPEPVWNARVPPPLENTPYRSRAGPVRKFEYNHTADLKLNNE